MNPIPSPSLDLSHSLGAAPCLAEPIVGSSAAAPARAESMQRRGKRMILAGFVITIAAVILYCAVCFAGGIDADMGDLLFKNGVPFARGMLGVMGLGTLVWLVGSFTYLRGAMDAEEAGTEGPSAAGK